MTMRCRTALLLLMLLPVFTTPARALTYEDYPVVRLRSLDKITARTMTFEAKVGSTVRFGDIYIKVQSCRKPPPVEKPESAAFLQIWEVDEMEDKSRWIYSGWMFASSPALSAMDHPIYDVWVQDCLGRDPEPTPTEEVEADKTDEKADEQADEKTREQEGLVTAEPPPTNPEDQPIEDQAVEDQPVAPSPEESAVDQTPIEQEYAPVENNQTENYQGIY